MLTIQNQALQKIKTHLPDNINRWIIIADQNLLLYAETIQQQLQCDLLYIQADEQHKTREYKQQIEDKLFQLKCNRHTGLIALGGGITTDFVGFIAATFYRGIPLVLVPTSLLAMVDACIGGKTAVNTFCGKNLIGCFYQPEKIIIDPKVLQTLPKHYLYDGMAEVIKHALLADHALFTLLEQNATQIINLDSATLTTLIEKNLKIKQQFVAQDEHDKGKRQLLNFGHTIGHALELASNHALSHGQAVALGMLAEINIGIQKKLTNPEVYHQVKQQLIQYQLPITFNFDSKKVLQALQFDKKNNHNIIQSSLITDIAKPYIDNQTNYTVTLNELEILNACKLLRETTK